MTMCQHPFSTHPGSAAFAQGIQQLCFRDGSFQDHFTVDNNYRNPNVVFSKELWILGDVHFLDTQFETSLVSVQSHQHVLAEVTTRFPVDDDRLLSTWAE